MSHFRIQDLSSLEVSPTSPGSLRSKIGDLLVHSISAAAKVELVNKQTGEYRILLQGTLDHDSLRVDH
jgi:hypothetical protein